MKYEEVQTNYMGISQTHIVIDNEDGSFKTFPADEENPEYVAFLAQLEQETE
jgi:hypothetical protein